MSRSPAYCIESIEELWGGASVPRTIYVRAEKCIGCLRCVRACEAVERRAIEPSQARLFIHRYADCGARARMVPQLCFQCAPAMCFDHCPSGAMYRDDNGVVKIDLELCVVCGRCVSSCPYGMVEMDSALRPYKCDGCNGEPACVKVCPTQALVFGTQDPELVGLREKQMRQRSTQGTPSMKRDRLGYALIVEAQGESG